MSSSDITTIFDKLDHCNEASCDFCPHFYQTHERYPYGDTTVGQPLFECRCTDANQCEQARIYFEDKIKDNTCV